MFWFGIMYVCSFLMDWLRVGQLSDCEKDLEILLRLALAERKLKKTPQVSHIERLTMAVVAPKSKPETNQSVAQLGDPIRVFKPETVWVESSMIISVQLEIFRARCVF